MAYTSVVDYLKAQGKASDYTSRSKLASQYGISGYTGTATQNTQLLSALQKPATPTIPKTNPTLPTGINYNLSGALNPTDFAKTTAPAPVGNYSTPTGSGGNSWSAPTASNNLFSVSRGTSTGYTPNSAGMQVPTGSPVYGPFQSDIKSDTAKAIYSPTVTGNQTPSQTFSSQSVDFFNQASKPSSTPSLPSTFDISSYSQGTNFNLPESKPATPDYSALLNSIRTDPQTSQRMTDLDVSIQNMMRGNENGDASLLDQQKNIMDLTGQIAGRDKRQFEAEKTAGVFDFQKQLNDVNSQINQLQKENEITKLNAQGQPIAQEEINKQTADADRRYAVKALGLSAIAQTIQGNLALAQDYATKSVEAEFAPLTAQLDYLKLALEYNKENFTREEKKRAEKLALMIDERERILETEKEEKKNVFSIMQDAVKAGADAQTLNNIINSKSGAEALIAGKEYLVANAAGLTDAQANNAFKLAADFEKASGDYMKIVTNYNKIQASATNPSPAGDLALIFSYMKMLDPGSVVREGEFATAQNAASVPDQIRNYYNRVASGERLNPEQRQDFVSRAGSLYQAETQQQQQVINQYAERAQAFGVPVDLVVRNMGSNYAGENTGQTGQRDALDDVLDGLGFNNAPGTALNGLGSLSEKYESGGNPGAIGYDSTGGYSYGAFQLAHNNAKSFIDQSPYKQAFQGLTFNSPEWRNRWKQVAQQDSDGFYNAQKSYIQKTHFEPQVQKLSSLGLRIDQLSPATLNAVWSTAVQHGPNTNIVANAVKKLPQGATEADLIKQIYTDRWAGGANFASSTPQVRQSVYNRFFGANGELNTALSMLS